MKYLLFVSKSMLLLQLRYKKQGNVKINNDMSLRVGPGGHRARGPKGPGAIGRGGHKGPGAKGPGGLALEIVATTPKNTHANFLHAPTSLFAAGGRGTKKLQ